MLNFSRNNLRFFQKIQEHITKVKYIQSNDFKYSSRTK